MLSAAEELSRPATELIPRSAEQQDHRLAFLDMPGILADGQALRRTDADRIFQWSADPVAIHARAEAVVGARLWPPRFCRHVMLASGNDRRGACVLLHRLGSLDFELIVWGTRMLWSRRLLAALAHWIFRQEGVRNLHLLLRPEDDRAHDLARRAGFRFSGYTSPGQFNDGAAASAWTMTAATCPWLKREH